MIITLKGADFSASNIGTLSSWRITRSLGTGASYEGVTSVDKDASFTATVTIAEGYELGTAGVTVTMSGNAISAATVNGNVITISIAEVTGNIVIKVPTVNLSTGEEEEPDVPDVNPNQIVFDFNSSVENGVNLAEAGTVANGKIAITTPKVLDFNTGFTLANNEDWTFECIALPSTATGLIPIGTTSSVGGFIQLPNPLGATTACLRLRDANKTMSAEASFTTGYSDFMHCAITYTAKTKTLKMYINYTEQTVTFSAGSANTFNSFTANKLFGGYTGMADTTYDFQGQIKYMRFTKGSALTVSEFHHE